MNKVIILLMLSLFLVACKPQIVEKMNSTDCKPEQRNADFCISVYQPVCGWFNQSIKCFKYPCATTYSNSCEACSDGKVSYYSEGECPK